MVQDNSQKKNESYSNNVNDVYQSNVLHACDQIENWVSKILCNIFIYDIIEKWLIISYLFIAFSENIYKNTVSWCWLATILFRGD